jgi:hypothetical protein
VEIPTDVTLSGSEDDVWIFQIAGNLKESNGIDIHLIGGAQSKNVFWQVAGVVDIGTTAHLQGIVLSKTLIAMKTGAWVRASPLGLLPTSVHRRSQAGT